MKIGIDVSQAIYGTGVSDYVVELVNALPAENLTLFGSSLRRQSDLKKLFPSSHAFPFPPAALNILWNKFHKINIENFLGPLDVFHSSDWTQPPSICKKITTIHDLTPFIYPQELNPEIVSVHTARMRWVVKECQAVICVSQSCAADFKRLFPQYAGQVHTIYEALPNRFLLSPQPVAEKDYLVAIGVRQPRKNISRLISAYHQFKSKYNLPEKLVIIGENTNQNNYSDVIFTGYISNQKLTDYVANAVAFIYPSLYEGFGLPILVAFYLKTPVATSNISSMPEIAGSAAALFDPIDEESMAIGISTAIKNKSQLVTAGTKQLSKFSWDKAAKQTLEVYKSLC